MMNKKKKRRGCEKEKSTRSARLECGGGSTEQTPCLLFARSFFQKRNCHPWESNRVNAAHAITRSFLLPSFYTGGE